MHIDGQGSGILTAIAARAFAASRLGSLGALVSLTSLISLVSLTSLISLVTARPAAATASPWISNPQSQVRLISADLVAPRQGELRLGIHFRLAPGWHVYWKNSGDAGFAPVVTWKQVPGLAPPELLWPAPHRFELPGGLEAFAYAGEVVYPVRTAIAAAPAGGRPAPLRLTANVDYLVCEVDCVPHRYDLVLDQPLGERAAADPQTAPLLEHWWREVPLAADRLAGSASVPAVSSRTRLTAMAAGGTAGPGELRLELRLRGVDAAPGGADLFFEPHPALELGRPRVRAADGGLLFEVPAQRKDASAPLPASTEIAWTATGLAQPGRAGTLAIAARQEVAIAVGAAPVPARRAADARPAPASRLRGVLAGGDPRAFALAAVTAALLTLRAWGLLRWRPVRMNTASQEAAAPARRREAAGFLALLATLALLYALSLEISAEGLAGVELALLAMSLVAWLRRRIERPGFARLLLAAALAACTIVPPWLASRNRLAADPATVRGAILTPGASDAAGLGVPSSSSTSTNSNRRSSHA